MYIREIHRPKRKLYRPELTVEYSTLLPPVFRVLWACLKTPKLCKIILTVGDKPVAELKYLLIPKIKYKKV